MFNMLRGGKKPLTLIKELDKIDLIDANIVLKNFKDIISPKYGRNEDKIKIGQKDNDISSRRLRKNSFSLILSFMNVERLYL